MDTSRYTIQSDQSHVSIKVHVLTDLYQLIQCGLEYPPFTDGGPPKLLYETGPWTGDNICTALECFFQSNAYHPVINADTRGASQYHFGLIPYLQFNRDRLRRRQTPEEKQSGRA